MVAIDITNYKYGKLTALNKDLKKSGYWVFKCDCGKIKSMCKGEVLRGHRKSCGCFHYRDIKGQRFSRLVVIEKESLNPIGSPYDNQ